LVKQGEVWLMGLETEGALQDTRVCVVLHPPELALLPTVIVAPMSTTAAATPFRVPVTFRSQPGLIVADQVRAIDKTRLVKRLGKIPATALAATLTILREMFGG
jgi:mRNA interferase MazF